MVTVKSNFRRWGGLVTTAGLGGAAALPPSGAASFVTASGAIFLSGSQLYVFQGANFFGLSAQISASGS